MMIFYPSKESCIKVFNDAINFRKQKLIFESMTAEAEETLFKESFFIPILKEIHKNPLPYIELRTIMFEFVQSLDEEERKTFLNLEITIGSLDATANSNVDNTNVKEIDYVEIDEDESEEEQNMSNLLINDSLMDDTINAFATDDDLNDTTTFNGADELMNDADKNDADRQSDFGKFRLGGEPTSLS
uniref:Uncharacterized protein n=1 Tax=Panagrolaimus davidi TaxID=227884 RepID=A0A914PSX7_9BILA